MPKPAGGNCPLAYPPTCKSDATLLDGTRARSASTEWPHAHTALRSSPSLLERGRPADRALTTWISHPLRGRGARQRGRKNHLSGSCANPLADSAPSVRGEGWTTETRVGGSTRSSRRARR